MSEEVPVHLIIS